MCVCVCVCVCCVLVCTSESERVIVYLCDSTRLVAHRVICLIGKEPRRAVVAVDFDTTGFLSLRQFELRRAETERVEREARAAAAREERERREAERVSRV